jgi:hypothetical protein
MGKPMAAIDRLYVLGGRQRKPLLRDPKQEWRWYDTALVLEVHLDSGVVHTRVEYQTPPDARADEHSSVNFHSGALVNDILYTCTATEVFAFQVPSFQVVRYFSLPCFNDLHHVAPTADGNLVVVNTGLDMILKCTPSGEIREEWSVLGEQPWTRFSRAIDYRKVETTKPHRSHPNYAFELDGELWATRFHQQDAISLNGSHRRIALSGEKPHDGLVYGNRLYFTAVDGKVVIVDRQSLAPEKIFNLRQIQDRDNHVLPAWCRGLLPVDDRRIWVGLTRIRKTQFRENVRWVKSVLGEGTVTKPTHIALFDLVEQACLREIDLEPYGMNAVYSIFPVPEWVR